MSPVIMMKENSKESSQETHESWPCRERKLCRARGHRPLSVVTTNAFDDDAAFMSAVRSILIHQETKTMSERDAINAVLVTTGDKSSFLESMDSRCVKSDMKSMQGGGLGREALSVTNMALLASQRFGDTVRLLWRESFTGYKVSSQQASSTRSTQSYRSSVTVKQKLLHSPMRSASRGHRSLTLREASILPKSSGRQRQRFFPDASTQSPLRSRIRLSLRSDEVGASDSLVGQRSHSSQQITQSPIHATV